ncbi:hypothetical protein pdam_00017260 [Pocillopora damicornis]|uniref:Uncharacterized protein n=1 Tax=Pocillopora damicornis TaxID=46731 RepID=A0A3M6UB09_POCDA|nr:hypothetical protein pdam_00017260 [Pocillopora damicornis]
MPRDPALPIGGARGINRTSDKNDYAFFVFITVAERDGTFHAGKNSHNHTAEFEAAIARKIVYTDKTKALENKFKPASAILNEVLSDELTESPCPAIRKPEYIARIANRQRQSLAEHVKAFHFKPNRNSAVFGYHKSPEGNNTLNKILPDMFCSQAGLKIS